MAITYTPTTNFGAKDSLPTNDPDKVIKGSEFTTEFTAIQTAFSLAAPVASPTFTGTVTIPTADINGGNIDGTVIGAATPAAGSFTTGQFGTSLNVDGTVTADGLTVDNSGTAISITNGDGLTQLGKFSGEATDGFVIEGKANNNLTLRTKANTAGEGIKFQDSAGDNMMFIDGTTGDISFYEDTGTTAKFFWDASAESLGIGTSSPQTNVEILSASTATLRLSTSADAGSGAPAYDFGAVEFFTGDASGIGPRVASKISAEADTSSAAPGGELVFYTAATNSAISEAMRIDASGNLLVGGTTAATKVTLDKTGFLGLSTLGSATDSTFTIDVRGNLSTDIVSGEFLGGYLLDAYDSAAASGAGVSKYNGMHFVAGGNFGASASDVDLVFATGLNGNAAERMRITSAGNVGIGTTSPAKLLHVKDPSSYGYARVEGASGGYGGILELVSNSIGSGTDAAGNIDFYMSTSNHIGRIKVQRQSGAANSGDMLFYTANAGSISERARIDSSGNLLVGKTAQNLATEGITINPNGYIQVTEDQSPTLYLNRLTTDGSIVNFYKDGSTVGSIGTLSNIYTYIGTDDTTLLFAGNLDAVLPRGTAGAQRDGAIDLGGSSNRFKDLYLSGGVYLGGTGAANKLDDYEEGTWTPSLLFGGASTGITYAEQTGNYTKVGNLVRVYGRIMLSNKGAATGDSQVSGLPFSANPDSGTPVTILVSSLTGITSQIQAYLTNTTISLQQVGSGTESNIDEAKFTNGSDLYFSITYKTNS